MSLIDFTILSFSSLFVIVDPVGLIPTFLSITQGNTLEERLRMARLATLTAGGILLTAALTGRWIFKVFGVTIPAFEIAGGIILLVIALDMLQGRRTAVKATQEEEAEGTRKDDVAITPLAVPMMAGPGAITTVILLSSRAAGPLSQVVLAANIVVVSTLVFLILRIASLHAHRFSVIAMRIAMRLMGLLLATIAVQFILNGITSARLLH